MNSIDQIRRCAHYQQSEPEHRDLDERTGDRAVLEPPPESPLVLVVGGLTVLAVWGLVWLVMLLIAY